MKRIHYASGSMVTGDAIADVILRYAAALAEHRTAAELAVPAVGEDGAVTEVLLVLGPASQIMAEHAPGADEFVDDEFVDSFEKKVAALGTRAGFVTTGTEESDDLDLDYL